MLTDSSCKLFPFLILDQKNKFTNFVWWRSYQFCSKILSLIHQSLVPQRESCEFESFMLYICLERNKFPKFRSKWELENISAKISLGYDVLRNCSSGPDSGSWHLGCFLMALLVNLEYCPSSIFYILEEYGSKLALGIPHPEMRHRWGGGGFR